MRCLNCCRICVCPPPACAPPPTLPRPSPETSSSAPVDLPSLLHRRPPSLSLASHSSADLLPDNNPTWPPLSLFFVHPSTSRQLAILLPLPTGSVNQLPSGLPAAFRRLPTARRPLTSRPCPSSSSQIAANPVATHLSFKPAARLLISLHPFRQPRFQRRRPSVLRPPPSSFTSQIREPLAGVDISSPGSMPSPCSRSCRFELGSCSRRATTSRAVTMIWSH